MGQSDDLFRQAQDAEKDRKKKEKKEKWAKREKKFWKAFLFTEDGKPKSGLLIYTFCMSFLFLAVYIVAFNYLIEWLTPVLAGLPTAVSNLLQSLTVSLVGILIGWLLHMVIKDKRVIFGTFLWLTFYLILVLVSLLIMLRGTGTIGLFLNFYLWFMVIPVLTGLAASFGMYKKDYVPPKQQTEQAPWKQYTQRR